MKDSEKLPLLENELRRTIDIIKYLEYLLMGKQSWRRETEFKIAKIRSSTPKVINNE